MKRAIFLSLLSLLLAVCLPAEPEPPPAVPVPTAAPPLETLAPAAAEAPPYPEPETINVLDGDTLREMALSDYLCGVVAAEMPAAFPLEALKAQAVAARSYALYCAGANKHGEAAVCTDFACCQAFCSEETLRERWGDDYDSLSQKIRSAVEDTAGRVLCYNEQPVFAAFHSSSAGMTESCGAIWSPLPYLVSVSSPETAADVPDFVSTVSCWPIDFRDTLLSARPEADFSGPESAWLGALRRDESGRVAEATLGGAVFSGTELRALFSLRSTAFTLQYENGLFVFTVTGHGHGVGMSQYGAKVMAEQGADFSEILAHYYPGAVLTGARQALL